MRQYGAWSQISQGGSDMNAAQQLHEAGQSLWLDNITRDLLNSGTLQPLHRRALGHRANVEPDDLRPRHQEQRRIRRGHPREEPGGKSGEAALLRTWRSRTSPRPPTCFGHPRSNQRRRRLRFRSKCRRCLPTTREHHRGGQRPVTPRQRGQTCSSKFRAQRRAACN